MTQTNQTAFSTQQTSITYPVAKKAVESMNLINGFLFDSSIEDEEDAKIVIGASHGKKLMEVLKYIVSGEKVSSENKQVNDLERVVSKIKKRREVTKKYMQQWDRERHLVMDTKKEAALKAIRLDRKEGISDEKIRNRLNSIFELSPNTINELFAQVNDDKLYPNSK